MSRRRITAKACVADRYAGDRERIIEVHSAATEAHAARGCLISIREVENAGKGHRGLIVDVYSADPGVFVRINGRDYKAPR